MKSKLFLTVCRTCKRILMVLSLALAAGPNNVLAQNVVNYCEPSGAVKDELKTLPRWNADEGSYKLYKERRLAALERLAQKHSGNFHVLKRLAEARRNDDRTDREGLTNEYRALMEKNPNDPAAAYFYATMLVGNNTKEAIAVLDKVVRQAPEFPWTYLELGTIYNYPAFRDSAKSRENLKKWATKCPDALDSSTRIMASSGDQELMRDALRRLRVRLATPIGPEDLYYYNEAWSLEFKLRPVPEHAQVRQQVADELKQLRAQNLGSKEWLQVLQEGYKLADDKEGRRWAEDEVLRLFPKSSAARRIVRQRWDTDHPRPKDEESEEKKRAYNQALIKATEEWLKQWPDDVGVWGARYFAMEEPENATNAEFEAAAQSFLEAMAKNEGSVYYIPPIEVIIARAYAKRNITNESIPALVEKGLSEIEQREKRNSVSDLYLREGGDEFSNLKYTRWYGWQVLAEAYAKLKQPHKAREVLAQMADTLKKDKPPENDKQSRKTGYQIKQVDYWRAVGKVAETENRKLDALISYWTALSFRPQRDDKDKSDKKDELADSAQRLWKELGGTEDGWQAYLMRREATRSISVAEARTWDERKQQLPEFELVDLQGRKWGLGDLKGKVTFINFWATWCGPCREELPYVQKLHEQMKGRKDVLVLTMNIDDELGLIEPFTKENKYSFPVIPAVNYARDLNVYSIPRNWVVNADGVLQFEGVGFGSDGNEWMKKANETIEKVNGSRKVKNQK